VIESTFRFIGVPRRFTRTAFERAKLVPAHEDIKFETSAVGYDPLDGTLHSAQILTEFEGNSIKSSFIDDDVVGDVQSVASELRNYLERNVGHFSPSEQEFKRVVIDFLDALSKVEETVRIGSRNIPADVDTDLVLEDIDVMAYFYVKLGDLAEQTGFHWDAPHGKKSTISNVPTLICRDPVPPRGTQGRNAPDGDRLTHAGRYEALLFDTTTAWHGQPPPTIEVREFMCFSHLPLRHLESGGLSGHGISRSFR
jgi:hypothetical protein